MSVDAHRVLVQSFAVLSDPQKENVRWHLDQGTPICCGRTAWYFVDSLRLAAGPEVLANTRHLEGWWQMNGTVHLHIPRAWEDTLLVFLIASGRGKKADHAPIRTPLFPYEWAIESDEATVRRALEEVVR